MAQLKTLSRSRRRSPSLWACGLAAMAAGCSAADEPPPRTAPPPSSTGSSTAAAIAPAAVPEPPAATPSKEAASCAPLKPAAFERPEHAHVDLVTAPIQWGERLAPFYEMLARLERGKLTDHLRIGFHGDSNLTKDGLTGEMRRVLQARYGDAGHGFIAPLRAWGWYVHQDVQQGNDSWWRVLAISAPRAPDLGYGLGGIAAETRATGAHTWFATAGDKSQFGRNASKIGVFYREQPGGGSFRIKIDGESREEIATRGDVVRPGHKHYEVADGPHRLDIETTTADVVRLFGVYFERTKPSIVVDSFGVGGVYFQALTLDDHELNRTMDGMRKHSLFVFWLGANPHYSHEYARDVKKVVEERRKANPTIPILIISPPDAVKRLSEAASDPMSKSLAARLGEAAQDNGCAFWPMRDAQGGDGAAGKFLLNGLSIDQQHLSGVGSALMARMLLHVLWNDYHHYLEGHPRAGCEGEAGD